MHNLTEIKQNLVSASVDDCQEIHYILTVFFLQGDQGSVFSFLIYEACYLGCKLDLYQTTGSRSSSAFHSRVGIWTSLMHDYSKVTLIVFSGAYSQVGRHRVAATALPYVLP